MDERKSFTSSKPAVETKTSSSYGFPSRFINVSCVLFLLLSVLIPLCVLFTQAPCRPARSREATISLALNEILIVRGNLDESLSDVNCSSVNVTEQVGLKQQPVSAQRLFTVRCYLQEFSKWIPEERDMLMKAAQFIKDVEELPSNSTTPQSCRVPVFKGSPEDFEFAKCFLELVLEERSNKSTL